MANNNEIGNYINKWIADSATTMAEAYERAGLAVNYKHGRQWDENKFNALELKGVKPITVNRCLPVVNTISGVQRQNKQDIRAYPRKYGTDEIASIYTELIKFTKDFSDGDFVFSQAFTNALVTGQDFIDIDVAEDRFAGGSLEMKRYSIFDTVLDPINTTYDLNNSGRYIGFKKRMPKQEAEILFGDKLGKGNGKGSWKEHNSVIETVEELLGDGNTALADDQYDPSLADVIDHIQQETYLVYKFWWREPIKGYRWEDREAGTTKVLTDSKSISRAKKAVTAKPQRFKGKDIITYKLHKTFYSNGSVLSDEVQPFGVEFDFMPTIRVSPYYDNGYAFGIIDNILGAQDEVNLNRTAMVRNLTKSINSGFKTAGGSPKAIEDLEMYGSTPGKVFDETKYGGKIERIEPAQLSQGFFDLSELSANEIKEISSVNDQMQGYDSGREESGRALELKRRQGLTSIEVVMDNLDQSFRIFGSTVIEFVRNTEVYTDKEIIDIIGKSELIGQDNLAEAEQKFNIRPPKPYIPPQPDPEKMQMVDPMSQQQVQTKYKQAFVKAAPKIKKWQKALEGWEQVVKEQAKRDLLDAIKSDKAGIYGIKVDVSPESPTVLLSNTAELTELAKAFPGNIPLQTLIKNSSITNKDEILQEINQQQQRQAQQAAQVQRAQQQQQQGQAVNTNQPNQG